jgi:hypothetical protein
MATGAKPVQESLGLQVAEPPVGATLTTRQAAERAGMSQRALQRLVQRGVSFTVWRNPQGYYRIDAGTFAAWLEQQGQARQALPAARRESAVTASQGASLGEQVRTLTREVRILAQRLTRLEDERELVALLRRQLEVAQERERTLLALLASRGARPAKPPTIRERIRELLRQEERPRRIWQIAQTLRLSSNAVRRELARMVDAEEISRIKPGLFVSGGRPVVPPVAVPAVPPARPSTLLERVVQLVEEAGRPLRATEIRQGLGVSRSVNQELSTLVGRGKLQRDAGRYWLPSAGDVADVGGEPIENPVPDGVGNSR